jgi:hypothetical protein
MKAKGTDVVSATEIVSWAWCPESWRLEALGREPGNKADLSRGRTFHTRTARAEVTSRRTVCLARWLLVLALLLAALWVVLAAGVGL